MDPTNPLAFLQNIFGSLSPGLQPGQSAGDGMPMNILPPVAQQPTPAPTPSGNSLIALLNGAPPSGGLLGALSGNPGAPRPPAQMPQQQQPSIPVAPAPLGPLQMPQPNYGMLSMLLRH